MIAGIFAVQRWSRGSRVRQLLRKWVGVEFFVKPRCLRRACASLHLCESERMECTGSPQSPPCQAGGGLARPIAGGIQAFGWAAWSFLTNEEAPAAAGLAPQSPVGFAWYIVMKLQGDPRDMHAGAVRRVQ